MIPLLSKIIQEEDPHRLRLLRDYVEVQILTLILKSFPSFLHYDENWVFPMKDASLWLVQGCSHDYLRIFPKASVADAYACPEHRRRGLPVAKMRWGRLGVAYPASEALRVGVVAVEVLGGADGVL